MSGTRAQVFTLEGVLAALVVLAGVVFALQAVVVTPSSSGANAGTVDVAQIDSVLAGAAENGTLKRAVLDVDGEDYDPATPRREFHVGSYPDNDFGRTLNESFDPAVTVNVIVHYREPSTDSIEAQRMIYNGAPADVAARSAATVTVFEDEVPSDFYAGNVSDATAIHTVCEVEVVAWRG